MYRKNFTFLPLEVFVFIWPVSALWMPGTERSLNSSLEPAFLKISMGGTHCPEIK
jgi:hypothetical protein